MEKRIELFLYCRRHYEDPNEIEAVDRDTKCILSVEELIGKRIKGIEIGMVEEIDNEDIITSIYLDIEE